MGGWNMAGIERFNAIYERIEAHKHINPSGSPTAAANMKPEWVAKEQAILTKLRTELGIQADNMHGHRGRRGRNADEEQPLRNVRARGFAF